MTWKHIEASREARLWVTQVVFPVIVVTAMIPEARKAVMNGYVKVKAKIKDKTKQK